MLSDNIKTFRKNKGYSQETLAEQLNVVRQTVSKWEKGISVPDAETLAKLSEILEVPVGDLLGDNVTVTADPDKMSEIAQQLAIMNERMALQSRNRKRIVKGIIIGSLVSFVLFWTILIGANILYRVNFRTPNEELNSADIECTLNGEHYSYGIRYDEHDVIREAGGDAFIAYHVQAETYSDAKYLIAAIEDYFNDRGGTVSVTYSD